MDLYLMYFDTIVGPRVFCCDPEPAEAKKARILTNIMDLATRQGFFEHREENSIYFNYYFEIPSDWARGKKEMLMLSVICQENTKSESIEQELWNNIQKLKQYPTIYKGFYPKRAENKSEIIQHSQIISDIISETAIEIRKIIEQGAIGDILILGHAEAGKSAIAERLTRGIFADSNKPTLSLQILKTIFESMKLRIYDIGGRQENHGLGFKACPNPKAIIFVVDYTAREIAITETRIEFREMFENFYLNGQDTSFSYPPLLIMANKIDLAENPSENYVANMLNLQEFDLEKIPFKIQLVSAKNDAGIREGFRWLVQTFLTSESTT